MKRLAYSTAIFLGFALVAVDRGTHLDRVSAAGSDEHAYFDSLTRRPDVWKSYSLRSSAQVSTKSNGGYLDGNGDGTPWVTYDPNADTDRHKQDAAKFVIPAFNAQTQLAQATGPNDTVLTLVEAYRPSYPQGKTIQIDREVMTVTQWLTDTTVSVARGSYASAPAAHAAGAVVGHSSNSLKSQLRLPLGTQDGHSYFFTWDSYWTDSFLGAGRFNHKAFQFSSGSQDGDAIFFEPDATYADTKEACWNPALHVAAVHARSYNKVGGVLNWLLTDGNSLGPGVKSQELTGLGSDFCFEPNQWVRFFVNIRQQANDYDYVDMWAADETHEAVQILVNVPISVRPTGRTPNSIAKFWVELNSSTDDFLRVDGRDLVAYVRNFVALQDNGDPRQLLVRPVPGAQAAPGPSAPRNVRIVQGS